MKNFIDLGGRFEFKLEGAFSRGAEKGDFGGYTIPVALSVEDASRVSDLAKKCCAENPVYGGKTIYLKVKGLTDKQRIELLGEGRMNILVHFEFTDIYTGGDTNCLIHRVTKLRKLGGPEEEEDIPED